VSLAARIAESRPASAPIAIAAAIPPAQASVGITTAQCLVVAYTKVAIAPAPTPEAPPASASRIASLRNWLRICPLVVPSARRSPISEALEHRDDHDVRDPDRADQQRDRAKPRNRPLMPRRRRRGR
jgi:hypothetical protein